ncbi:MAG TPA: 30S ribosomal protein S20 [Bryobacteraceae bacterium]|nr:30S ribosomal protein S20 [Bryobacteraceae bacterium]
MANTVSALKRVRQTERRTEVNRLRKSRMRTQIKKMRKLLESKDLNAAQAALPATYSIVDRAAKWGVIKKNTAARYKARVAARLHRLAAPAA